ncbi:MAG TPA: carboxymuconolactone decarboxylase family protein [Actinomycetota bacterium]
MPRIPPITERRLLDPEGQVVFDRIVESRGSVLRPFELLMHSPAMADKVADLGHVIRFDSHLADADRELVTLATGRAHGCTFVWESHLETARTAGIDPEALLAADETLSAREKTLVAFVDELCATGAVSDATFQAVDDLVGTQGIVELILTVGYYTMLAYTMSASGAC